MFIQTEPTPNPNALKFIPGREVAPGTSIEYRTIEEAAASPLAEALFELEGVDGVFFGEDYVSVTRHERGPGWGDMKASILSVIMDHFVSGAPLLRYEAKPEGHAEQEDDEIILEICWTAASALRWRRTVATFCLTVSTTKPALCVYVCVGPARVAHHLRQLSNRVWSRCCVTMYPK